jgi:predicted amino acid racemase
VFLESLRRRNPEFIAAAIELHQSGEIPAGAYVLDLDAISRNARRIRNEADRVGVEVFAMTKQLSRGKPLFDALSAGGIDHSVAVDLQCAAASAEAGMTIGNVGHLVQIPRAVATWTAALAPLNWTVFNLEKAAEAGSAAQELGRVQPLLARIVGRGDRFYPGHEGGFDADTILRVAETIDGLPGARFAGVTTFPALLFDERSGKVRPTTNLRTLARTAELLSKSGRHDLRVNAPGTTSTTTLATVANAGATQVEPGHGLTGSTPLHALENLPEEPAALYLSEISHHVAARAYCFGGGLYIDPVFRPYQLQALVSDRPEPDAQVLARAELPPPDAIDYYGMLTPPSGARLRVGATVIFGFRIQAFVTRAPVVGLTGVGAATCSVAGIWRHDGSPTPMLRLPRTESVDPAPGAGRFLLQDEKK